MKRVEEFESGHNDRVTVLHVNYDGSRILTASIDHRIKVWNVDRQTKKRTLLDTWTAHDADVRDAKFLHPTTGSHIATIGNDLKFQLFTEDVTQAPNSGRRFRRIATIQSTPRVPFVSMDFKVIDHIYTYLALIDRQGLLSVYEPASPDEFKEWTLIDQFHVCNPAPGRGEETSFKVRWDQNPVPLPYLNSVSDDRAQLGLVVTALNHVQIYRSVTDSGNGQNPANGASHSIMFYEVARLPTHPGLVRDVQWAPFNVRGVDRFATACKDGGVRIYDLNVLETDSHQNPPSNQHQTQSQSLQSSTTSTSNQSQRTQPNSQNQPQSQSQSQVPSQRQSQSSLTSAITGRSYASTSPNQSQIPTSQSTTNLSIGSTTTTNTNTNLNTNINPSQPQPQPPLQNQQYTTTSQQSTTQSPPHPRSTHQFPYPSQISLVAHLDSAHPDAWSLSWDNQGQILLSNGSDGITKLWRKSILGGKWLLFADQSVDIRADDDDDVDDDNDDDDDESDDSDEDSSSNNTSEDIDQDSTNNDLGPSSGEDQDESGQGSGETKKVVKKDTASKNRGKGYARKDFVGGGGGGGGGNPNVNNSPNRSRDRQDQRNATRKNRRTKQGARMRKRDQEND